jgi:hypothetical protein
LKGVAKENHDIGFQQDGCQAHFSLDVRNLLNDSFPNCSIGKGGGINWPVRSADLAPCDFFLWDHLKAKFKKDATQILIL